MQTGWLKSLDERDQSKDSIIAGHIHIKPSMYSGLNLKKWNYLIPIYHRIFQISLFFNTT